MKEISFHEGNPMRMARLGGWFLCAAIAVASAAAALAQNPPVVSAGMVLATDAVHAGAPVRAAVQAKVASGFHINDHHPTLDYLIPTELKLEPSPKFTIAKLVYPKGELKSFAFSDTRLSVYQGTFEIGALLDVASRTPAGDYKLEGKLSYQACNDHACLPPASVPVSLTVKVVGKRVPLNPANREIFRQIKFD
jgi:Thiol:disulfide interchange protein DsbD, N-terminal